MRVRVRRAAPRRIPWAKPPCQRRGMDEAISVQSDRSWGRSFGEGRTDGTKGCKWKTI